MLILVRPEELPPWLALGTARRISGIAAEVQRQGCVFETVESYPHVVKQSGIEDVTPVRCHALHLVVESGGSARPCPSVQVWEIGGVRCVRSGNRVVGKKSIFFRDIVVEPRLERSLVEFVFSVENEIIREPSPGNIGTGKQIDDILAHTVDASRRDA